MSFRALIDVHATKVSASDFVCDNCSRVTCKCNRKVKHTHFFVMSVNKTVVTAGKPEAAVGVGQQ